MYIVTGGAGFIGSVLVGRLNELGIEDIVIVDSLSDSSKWKNIRNKFYLDYIHKNSFLELLHQGKFKNVKAVVHMGASSSTTVMDMDYLMNNNVYYTAALAEYCVKNNIRFVYASSAATYGDGEQGYSDEDDIKKFLPLNPYGYSKQLFDLMALRKGYADKIAGLKFFNVYGPNEYHKGGQKSVVVHAFNQIQETGKVKLFKSYLPEYKHGEQLRDFVYVKDCVEVIWKLLQDSKINGIYNVGTGTARSWNDLVTAVFSALKLDTNIEYIEMPDNLKNQYQYYTKAEMNRLKATSAYVDFNSIEEGVTDFVQNYLAQDSKVY